MYVCVSWLGSVSVATLSHAPHQVLRDPGLICSLGARGDFGRLEGL